MNTKNSTYDRLKLFGLIVVFCFGLISILASGGGGGEDGVTGDNKSVGGLWEGEFYSQPLQQSFTIIGVASEDGEVHFISEENAQYSGNANVSGSSVSGTFKGYAPLASPNWFFLDNSKGGPFSISGTVVERDSFDGLYSGLGDTGSFTLDYDNLYDRDPSLSDLAGRWNLPTLNGEIFNLNITVQANGTFTGSDGWGSTYSGAITIIDPEYNCYRTSLTETTSTSEVYTYSGILSLGDNVTQNDTMYFGVESSDNRSVAGIMMKQ